MKELTFLCVCMLALSACMPAANGTDQAAVNSAAADTPAPVESQVGTAEESSGIAAPLLLEAGDACGTNGKPPCPLVKPTGELPPEYDRTPEQLARLETFDQLTLEEKFIALDQGLIVCTEFIHDEQWEHQIDPALAALVGQDKFNEWLKMDDGCHSIYHFANAFLLDYGDMAEAVRTNGLEKHYPLEALRAGMEKWCAA